MTAPINWGPVTAAELRAYDDRRRAEARIAAALELVDDALREHRVANERGNRMGHELHQLDGAAELAQAVRRALTEETL